MDWQIYTRYSGHQSFTKGLLLVDQSAKRFRRALEITAKDVLGMHPRGRQGMISPLLWGPQENAVLLLFDASHYFWDSRIDDCFEGFNFLGRYVHSGCPEVFRSHPARISRRQDCKWRTRTEGNEWVARGFAQKQFIISLLFVLLLMVSFVLFFVAVDGPKEPSNV